MYIHGPEIAIFSPSDFNSDKYPLVPICYRYPALCGKNNETRIQVRSQCDSSTSFCVRIPVSTQCIVKSYSFYNLQGISNHAIQFLKFLKSGIWKTSTLKFREMKGLVQFHKTNINGQEETQTQVF